MEPYLITIQEMICMLFLGLVLSALCAYLMGSINSAIIVSQAYAKEDIRNYGSGNAGMTNILRTYGKFPAAFTALGDFAKGALAVLLGRLFFSILGVEAFDGGFVAGFFAILGHLFPVYFGFRGGKGVLTSAGVILVIHPLIFLILAAVIIPFIFITRIVSLGSLLAAVLFPILVFFFCGKAFNIDLVFSILMSVTVIFMHRENIKRLLNGTENRFPKGKKGKTPPAKAKKK